MAISDPRLPCHSVCRLPPLTNVSQPTPPNCDGEARACDFWPRLTATVSQFQLDLFLALVQQCDAALRDTTNPIRTRCPQLSRTSHPTCASSLWVTISPTFRNSQVHNADTCHAISPTPIPCFFRSSPILQHHPLLPFVRNPHQTNTTTAKSRESVFLVPNMQRPVPTINGYS